MQLILKALIIVFACAFTVTEATALQRAKSCVSGKWGKTLSSSDEIANRAEFIFSNRCSYKVSAVWRTNYGNNECSSRSSWPMEPGRRYTATVTVEKPHKPRLRWCVNYWHSKHQNQTGYKDCYDSNKPSCPAGTR